MNSKILVFILVLQSFLVDVLAQTYIDLWPNGQMPNSKHLNLEEIESRDRITQVATPGMWVFRPSTDDNNGAAVLIFPPGGYQKLTYNIAGFQLAKWFNTMGVTAFVVKYRLPNSPDLINRQNGPLQDAQRAMKLVRLNAEKFGVDTTRIGVMGASAGGHLTALVCTSIKDVSKIGDELDNIPFLPAFGIMVSAVIDMGDYAHKGSRANFLGELPTVNQITTYSLQNSVSPNTPPCFMVHAMNDPVVNPMNSILFYQALLKQKVSGCSLHIFPEGGHSIALRNNPGSTAQWTVLCEAWMKHLQFIVE